MKFKRILCALLASLMLAGVLASCATGSEDNPGEQTKDNAAVTEGVLGSRFVRRPGTAICHTGQCNAGQCARWSTKTTTEHILCTQYLSDDGFGQS